MGTLLAMGESRFCETTSDFGQHVHDGLVHVVLKDECIPVPTGKGHVIRLTDFVSVIEPSDISLADVKFCLPSHGDPHSNHDIFTCVAVVCDHGWRLLTLPSSTPNLLPPIMKIENEF